MGGREESEGEGLWVGWEEMEREFKEKKGEGGEGMNMRE